MLKKLMILVVLLAIIPRAEARKRLPVVPDSLQRFTVKVNGVSLEMQRVEGGSFMMGATPDQTDAEIYNDKPAHLVFLSPFYIATTEVTTTLWQKIMTEREVLSPKGFPTHPINYVTWYDCQEFVRRLDSITGLSFRLPTEAEWEYAARGGHKSKAFRFAGGNEPDSVGWIYSCSGNWTHPVARKRPNELGLYDMTGNVSEWCQDRYGRYQLGTAPNPCGVDTGMYRVVRGGSYDECAANTHISFRRWLLPETSAGYIGFRLALTLPDDPMTKIIEEEPPLTRTIKLKDRRLRFIYVPAEQPYYISEEIECSLWKKIMKSDATNRVKHVAVGMSHKERLQFAERCSKIANEAMFIAAAEYIVAAEQKGLIEPFQNSQDNRRKTQSIRQIQRKRRIADKLSPWTELVGFRLPKPDDPVLLQFKKEDDDSRPLRLIIKLPKAD